jgi:hypothetical protein
MKQYLPAAAAALIVCSAQAQTYRDSVGTVVPGVVPIQPGVGPLFTPSNPGNVAGTFSASLSGFTPTPSYKQLTSGGTSSVSTAVPTGTVDVVYNTSTSVAYCTYGSSGVAATSTSDVIQASSWVAFTVPSGATTIACISPSGNLGINVSGGSGLPTGAGGGGGGGPGSNASVGSTGSSPPSSGTYLGMNVGGNLTGLTGTANGLKVDGSAVTQPVSAASLPLPSGAATATNQTAVQTTTGSSVPGSANYVGMNVSGNLTGLTGTSNGLKVDGSAVTQPTAPANNSVGAANQATSGANCTTSSGSTVALAARPGAIGTGRISVTVTNTTAVAAYFGNSGVTTTGTLATAGQFLPGIIGAQIVFPTTAAIYCVTGASTATVTFGEVY